MIHNKSFDVDKIDEDIDRLVKRRNKKSDKKMLEKIAMGFRYPETSHIFAAVMHHDDVEINYNNLRKKIGLNAANLVIEISDSIEKRTYESDEEFITRKRKRKLEILATASPWAIVVESIYAFYMLETIRSKIKNSDLIGNDLLPANIEDLNYQEKIVEIVYDRLPNDPISTFLKEKYLKVSETAKNRLGKIEATLV